MRILVLVVAIFAFNIVSAEVPFQLLKGEKIHKQKWLLILR